MVAMEVTGINPLALTVLAIKYMYQPVQEFLSLASSNRYSGELEQERLSIRLHCQSPIPLLIRFWLILLLLLMTHTPLYQPVKLIILL